MKAFARTCTEKLPVAVTPPPVAVTVIVPLAGVAEIAAHSVNVEEARPPFAPGVTGFALQLAVTPAGRPLTARVTGVKKELLLEIVIASVAYLPVTTLIGPAASERRSERAKVTVKLSCCEAEYAFPVVASVTDAMIQMVALLLTAELLPARLRVA